MKNKGFIFSIDAAVALFVMVLALVTVSYFSYQAEKSPYIKLQLERTAYDVLMVLDARGLLQSANASLIGEGLNESLPSNADAHLTISTYYKDTGGFNLMEISDYGSEIPSGRDVYEVEYSFVGMGESRASNYSVARMSIWER